MGSVINKIGKRFSTFIASLLLVIAQLSPMAAVFISTSQSASAAPVCTNDTQGANDEPGQKDLTKLCVDYAGLPTTATTTWNWDETGTSGNNTMDACNLFDTDGDGNINYSVCVTTKNDPATFQTLTTYSCGDDKVDRCTSPASVVASGTTSCSVTQVTNDPFPAGTSNPKDTQGSCVVQLSTVGGSSAKLVDVCSYPSSQPNSDPSDCVIIADDKAKIEVPKDLSPDNDPGLFDLKINGTTYANDVGDGGTTGEQVIDIKNNASITVLEAEGPSTDLANYSTTVVCRDLNGTGSIVGQSSPTGADTRQLTFTAADQSDIVCTFTNTRQSGSITLIKSVVNDNGGTAGVNDFGLSIGSTSVTSGQKLDLNTGSYAINEAGLNGYQFVSITGTGCPQSLGGSVSLTNGQNVTCTITNTDIPPSLTLAKTVTNDNGGQRVKTEWTLKADGSLQSPSNLSGSGEAVSGAGFKADTYTLSESGPSDYDAGTWSCTNGITVNQNSQITLGLGQSTTCTINNNDKPGTLIVKKSLTQDNGGTDLVSSFKFSINGGAYQFFESDTENAYVVNAGTYDVVEFLTSAYSTSYNNCDDIVVPNGGSATCTITNNDIAPKLTVTKVVTNDDGGELKVSDFTLYVDDQVVVSGVQNNFNAGTVTVSEDNEDGYIGSISGDCDPATGAVTMVLGGVYSCTITNDDKPGTLIVKKVLITDNGGTETYQDFSFKVNNGESKVFESDGENHMTVPAGIYSVVEDVNSDYTTTYDNCTRIVIPNGGTATCTITNNDKPAELIVVKNLITDNGSTKTVTDFGFAISGSAAIPSQQFDGDGSVINSLNAGTYTVTEDAVDGFVTTYSDDCIDVVLMIGDSKTCTVTNNDKPGKLIVNKKVVNDNGGNATADDFSFELEGFENANYGFVQDQNDPLKGSKELTLDAGTYTAIEDEFDGYTMTDSTCNDVVVANGQTATCTITNDDIAPSLTVVKKVVNDNGGTATVTDFNIENNGNNLSFDQGSANGSTVTYTANPTVSSNTSYALSEIDFDGYAEGSWSCTDGSQGQGLEVAVTLNEGESVSCTITNDDIAPTLTLKKVVVNDNGGDNDADEWTLKAQHDEDEAVIDENGTLIPDTDGTEAKTTKVAVSANTWYDLSEYDGPAGYDASDWDCEGREDSSNKVLLSSGENITCTITNNDASPKLSLYKTVVDEHGDDAEPADWTLTATPGNGLSGNGENGFVEKEVDANQTYILSESGPDGYSASEWACSNTAGSFSEPNGNGTIELSEGAVVTCYITNTSQAPQLIVKKVLITDDGSDAIESDFTINISGDNVSDSSFPAEANPGTTVTLNVGLYTVNEDEAEGFTTTYSEDCSGNIGVGDVRICTVTNDDIAPKLEVVKYATNDNGGTTKAADFNLLLNDDALGDPDATTDEGTESTATYSDIKLRADTEYEVSEEKTTGYENTYINCYDVTEGNEDAPVVEQPFTPQAGHSYFCAVGNNDKPGKLIVNKKVVNDNGGNATADDFSFELEGFENANYGFVQDQNDPLKGSKELTLDAGTYTAIEDEFDGYTMTDSTCNDVVVANGQTATCTITNDDIAPTLTLKKVVVNDNGGDNDADEWTLKAQHDEDEAVIDENGTLIPDTDGTEAKTTKVAVSANTWYDLSEYDGPAGYDASDWDCEGGNQDGNALSLALDEDVVCTITNNDKPPRVYVKKTVVPSNSEQEFNFVLMNDGEQYAGFGLGNGDEYNTVDGLKAGSVDISETVPDGWFQTATDCHYDQNETAVSVGTNFKAELGQTYYCEFVNKEAGKITVTKFHDINENKQWDEDEPTLEGWEMDLGEESETSNENGEAIFDNLMPNETYVLSENLEGQDGWLWSNTYCVYGEGEGYGRPVEDNNYRIRVYPGADIECFVGNHRAPQFTLTKSNNKPDPVDNGEEVTYTLVVSVPEANISGRIYGQDLCDENLEIELEQVPEEVGCHNPVKVFDLPPEFFTYVLGSWTADSNIRGNLKTLGITPEPGYGSPGAWLLTSQNSPFLVPGEIITLTYKAIVGDQAGVGVHPDLAFAVGFTVDGNARVLANASQPTPFVSTDVEIVEEPTEPGVVLGTSTLAVTGQNILPRLLIGLLIVTVVILLGRRSRHGVKMLIVMVAFGSCLWLLSSGAGAIPIPTTTTKLQKLQSPTTDPTFNLTYQILSTVKDNEFKVTLLVNGSPSGSSQTVTTDYGDSGALPVSLGSDGTYDLKVKVETIAGPDSGDVEVVDTNNVILDRSKPAAPNYQGKTVSGHKNTLSFTVPAGSDVQSVDIYASTDPSFTLNSTTKVGSVAATPGMQQHFSYVQPTDGTYYFALVARDVNGNVSAVVGDKQVTIVRTASTSEDDSGSGGSVAGAQNQADSESDDDGEVAGTNTEDDDGENSGANGSVGGAAQNAANQAADSNSNNNLTAWLLFAAAVALCVVVWRYLLSSKQAGSKADKDKK